jgi:hypothetical protein
LAEQKCIANCMTIHSAPSSLRGPTFALPGGGRFFALMAALLVSACAGTHAVTPTCRIESGQSREYLELPLASFDQDELLGWRKLGNSLDCTADAARMIQRYRSWNAARLKPVELTALAWHEGQMWAASGQTAQAIEAIEASIDPENLEGSAYAAVTLAFLRGDRPAFDRARQTYLAIPAPPGFAAESARLQRELGIPPLVWPLNTQAVDNLARCFGQPYSDAYAGRC